MATINCTGSAEGALVPVLLRITHWPKTRAIIGQRRTLREHACKTSAHVQGLYFQIGGCECELHNKNACF